MGRSMGHIAHQPGPVCLEGGVSRWLVGVVDLGAELLQRLQAARGALLQFEWLRKTRGAQAFARCAPRPSRDGRATSPVPGGGGRRRKAVALPQPTSPVNVQEGTLIVHVARW
jgi:hypothetical protein